MDESFLFFKNPNLDNTNNLVIRTCLLRGGISSKLHMRLLGPSLATAVPGHVFHYCMASLWSETQ